MIGRSWYVKVWLVNPRQKDEEVTIGAVDELEVGSPGAASSGNPHPSDVVGEGPPAVATPSPDVVEAPEHGMVEHVPPPIATEVLLPTSSITALKKRLEELRAPTYGNKAQLYARVEEFEVRREKERLERNWQIERAKDIASGELVRAPLAKKIPGAPSPEEFARHVLTHLPRADWCLTCLTATPKQDPHRVDVSIPRGPPKLLADFCYLKEDCERYDERGVVPTNP